ncbi:MAG: ABC transporter ATP-binding protein [Azospirillaceae bacterium]
MLAVEGIHCRYGRINALRDASLTVGQGEFVCLIGANGAGKSTMLRAISGLMPVAEGAITFEGKRIDGRKASAIVGLGIAHCPEERKLWPQLTVAEHLDLGAFTRRDSADAARDRDRMLEIFPRIAERRDQLAGTLSGGEQQMVAIARALMSRPRLLMMDEPSLGLAPVIIDQLAPVISDIHASGTAILLVEQNAAMALAIADRAYVLETGTIVRAGTAGEIRRDPKVAEAYLGLAAPEDEETGAVP